MKQSIVRGSLISLSIRLLDLPCRYGFHLLIAASLGVADTGSFYIVFSIVTALAGLGRLGIDQALTRQLAINLASDQPTPTRATIIHALRLVLVASVAVALILAAGAHYFAHSLFNKPDLAFPLVLGALMLIPQNIGAVLAGGLAGLHRVGYSQAIYSWLWPAIFCLIALPAVLTGTLTVSLTFILIAVSFTLAAITGAVLIWRTLARLPNNDAPVTAIPPLFRPGLSLFTQEISRLLITTAPAIVLGIYATEREAGLFALAWRIALIVNLLISGVTAMAMPKFASLYAQKDREGLAQNAAQAIGLVLCISLPLTLCMIAFPQTLLSAFGPGYSDGAITLQILAIGQIAAACFTAMPELLGMTDHRAMLARINALTILVLLISLAILVPIDHSRGAALATAFAILVNGALATWQAYRLLNVLPHKRIWHALGLLAVRARILKPRATTTRQHDKADQDTP
jgi:O-antigen/teichoic acid export membrane protein